MERLSIQKQTPKKNYDVGKILDNIFRRIEYRFLLDAFLEQANFCIYPACFVGKLNLIHTTSLDTVYNSNDLMTHSVPMTVPATDVT